jgi:hypothetical protein
MVVALCASFAGCAKIGYVTNGTIKAINEVKSGEWQNGGADAADPAAAANAEGDPVVLEAEFTEGTYGGKEFKTVDDVVKYYVEVFNYNKTLTAPYKENGESKTYYKLLGDEELKIASLLVDGKENATINKLVPSIMGSLFSGSPKGLPPAANRDPQYDQRDDGPNGSKLSQLESHLTADDVLDCNVKDNGDGTIDITIQPKAAELSKADQDSQGRFFNVLGDITSTVAQISVLSFSQGDANDNVKVTYKGGYGTVTVDTKTNEVTKAYYIMKTHLDVTHANITIIKDKSATMDLEYTNTFPASDQFLKDSKGITKG